MTESKQCSHTLQVQCLSDEGHPHVLHQNGASTWTSDAPGASTTKVERPSRGERVTLDALLVAVRDTCQEYDSVLIKALADYDAEVARLADRDALLAALESAALMYGTPAPFSTTCQERERLVQTLHQTAIDLARYDGAIHPKVKRCNNV